MAADPALLAILQKLNDTVGLQITTIETNTEAINTQSALMLVAVASLNASTDAVTVAIEAVNGAQEVRQFTLCETRDLVMVAVAHLEIINNREITIEDLENG